MLLKIDEPDQKLQETVFSIDICRQSGDKWQLKNLFLTIFDLGSFSIATFPLCFLSPMYMNAVGF